MVTIRSYTNPVDAALAKSLLDNYEIPCALLHENANLYTRGAQLIVPIRLMVDEADADLAVPILDADFDKAAEIDLAKHAVTTPTKDTMSQEIINRNPWELLVLAFYLSVPAVGVLQKKVPTQVVPNARIQYLIVRANITHFLAWIGLVVAIALVVSYFLVRRDRDNKIQITATRSP